MSPKTDDPGPASEAPNPALDTCRYVVGDCVGVGGLGSVHRAWDTQLGRWVAVKRLNAGPDSGDPAEAATRLRQEANALAALQHPHIVTVHDFGADAEGPFVVMEFIEGETLDAIAGRAPLDVESFGTLAVQILGAVEAAHRAGLIHRDLKPGNIMLTGLPDGGFTVKVLDFGLAKFAPQPVAQTLDQGHSLLGSIYFMAPEQFRREPLDARTDIYALGVIFFYSLTGYHPFDGDTTAQVMAAHLEGRLLRPLAQLRPDVPPALAAWVERLMSRVPTERPATAAAALALVRPLLVPGAHLPGGVVQRTGAVPLPLADPGRSPRSLLWPLVGAGVVSLTAGGFFVNRALGPRPAPAPSPAAATSAPVPSPTGDPTARAAVAPVVSSTPRSAQKMTFAPAAVEGTRLEATDPAVLRTHLGQTITVTGTPLGVGQSRNGTTFYLNFGSRPHEGLAVVCFGSAGIALNQEDFRVFVGKPVTVRGKLGDFKGDLQIVIQSPADVQVVP